MINIKKGASRIKKRIGTLNNEVNNFNLLQINKVKITIQVSNIIELIIDRVFMDWFY